MLALTGGTVVDANGARQADVVVRDGRIVGVGDPNADPDDADETIDAAGRYVVPGLIDAHVHLALDGRPDAAATVDESVESACYRASSHLRKTLDAGVTTVRDLGAPGRVALDAGVATAERTLDGPRVVACGRPVTMTGGHGHWFGREADGPDEVRRAAREQLKRGAGVVKCVATGGVLTAGATTGAPELTREELDAAVGAATAKGVPAAAHAHGERGIRNAVEAGVASVEHGTGMRRETAELLAERGTYWVPTASALRAIVDNGVEGGIPDEAVAKAEDATERFERAWNHALDADVPVAMGTDAGTPFNPHGESALCEMERMVEYGLSPGAALRAATVDAAHLLGLSDTGLVEEGYRADLLVLDANPAEDASAWRESHRVVRAGDVVR